MEAPDRSSEPDPRGVIDDRLVEADPHEPMKSMLTWAEGEMLRRRLADAEKQAEVLSVDRDWWMRQHDEVLKDWKSDLVRSTRAQTNPDTHVALAALGNLLRFFDTRTGAISATLGCELIFDAFSTAAEIWKAEVSEDV